MEAARLAKLSRTSVLGREVSVARGPWARALGLALLDAERAAPLLIPRCASVHTFGMRFAVDLVFLDRDGRPLRVVRAVPPRRIAGCRGAAAVLEIPAAPASSPYRSGYGDCVHPPRIGGAMSLIDKLKGRFKKAAGDVSGDPSLRREGSEEERKGEQKEKLTQAEEEVERRAEEVSDLKRRT